MAPSVRRLIFVGDHNQLPPIGRGKVFADLIEWLKKEDSSAVGVLKTSIRQMKNRLLDRGTGILDLASGFQRGSAEGHFGIEMMLSKLQRGGDVDKDLRVVFWKDSDELKAKMFKYLQEDLRSDMGSRNQQGIFDLWLQAHGISRWASDGSAQQLRTEYLQIISPYRGETYGTGIINLEMQAFLNGRQSERGGFIGGFSQWDKIIQTVNRYDRNAYKCYNLRTRQYGNVDVFNGELGFIREAQWKNGDKKQFRLLFSKKAECSIIPKDDDLNENMELAYAISVHKAQGSEFERVYMIVPKHRKALMSTELLYTGITRAQRHLTLFVQENAAPLISMMRPEWSRINRINSSLFKFQPVPTDLLSMDSWYEEGKVYHTLAEFMVRSKSEVIIANMLHQFGVPFTYEMPLTAGGKTYLPDFTITWDGEDYYWEHLGMMNDKVYRSRWETKKAWYDQHFPGRLITTVDSGAISKDAKKTIERLIDRG